MPLPDDSPEKWEFKEHTLFKLTLLEKYMRGWIFHLSRANKKIIYFDGFAGRGRDVTGKEGSPLVVIKLAKKYTYLFDEFICINVEKNNNNFSNLVAEITKEYGKDPQVLILNNTTNPKGQNKKIRICNFEGEFIDVVGKILENVKGKLAPSFFFIDPFGFKGVPLCMIKQIFENKKIEIFFNFMYDEINRFLTSKAHENCLTELFDTEEWKRINKDYSGMEKEKRLVELYRKQLQEKVGFEFTWPFRVCIPGEERTKYYLIHATNHFKGFKLIKDITYNAGSVQGVFAYLGQGNGGKKQSTLLDYNALAKKFVLTKFNNRTISFDDLIYESYLIEDRFIEKHYRAALLGLEKDGKIKIERISSKKTGLKEKDEITFI